MNAYRGVEVLLHSFFISGNYLPPPTALLLGKEPTINVKHEAGWFPGPDRRFWRKEKISNL